MILNVITTGVALIVSHMLLLLYVFSLCFLLSVCFLSCALCISVASLRQPYILIYVFSLCFLFMFSFLCIVHFCRIFATALISELISHPFPSQKGVIRG